MSEWKPGDVAMVSLDGEDMVAVRGHWLWADRWFVGAPKRGSQHGWRDESLDAVRPLAVIDFEDRAEVERLDALIDAGLTGKDSPNWAGPADILQAALREFAKPTLPKPDEPTGLGAVVRDESGEIWVLAPTDGSPRVRHQRGEWVCSHSTGSWAAIDAVEVLSEGVTP